MLVKPLHLPGCYVFWVYWTCCVCWAVVVFVGSVVFVMLAKLLHLSSCCVFWVNWACCVCKAVVFVGSVVFVRLVCEAKFFG